MGWAGDGASTTRAHGAAWQEHLMGESGGRHAGGTAKAPSSLEKGRPRAEAAQGEGSTRQRRDDPCPPLRSLKGLPLQGVHAQRRGPPPGVTQQGCLRPQTQRPLNKAALPATLRSQRRDRPAGQGAALRRWSVWSQHGPRHRLGKRERQWHRGGATGTLSWRLNRGTVQSMNLTSKFGVAAESMNLPLLLPPPPAPGRGSKA